MATTCLPLLTLLACSVAAAGHVPANAASLRPDILIADFESDTYAPWQVTGIAFGAAPAKGTLPNQMSVTGFKGKGLVNSYFNGDASTGTLTSPPFTIERKFINFLIGGGQHPDETCINLLIDGKIVRTATGPNDRPGGSETLDWHSWDVTDLEGKTAAIRIVDSHTGGWGHINIDHIYLADRKARVERTRDLLLNKRYLNLPVRNGAPKRRMSLLIDDQTVREFEIELADDRPDFWVFMDVTTFAGKQALIKVDSLDPDSNALASITLADAVVGAENLYREKGRQQLHFSSRRGWNNDSNGLVFLNGEYHLYYQHNPYGWAWGNMHWGHAVSTDLVHWQELPIAIYPHRFGDWVFSGSAVVDVNNTAAFKTGPNHVIVAAYTSTARGECIAFSNDLGRTFTDYHANPVVRHQGRDPKLIWFAPARHWVMAVYDEKQNSRGIAFYSSPDLKTWNFKSRIDGYYECPEIFELPLDSDKSITRWVLYAADGAYSIGSFDGKTFTPQSPKHRLSYGNCFYASQTFNNVPPSDARRIQVAWGQIATPDMPFNQCMLFPVELTLRNTPDGLRMFANPIKEIQKLHRTTRSWTAEALTPGRNLLSDVTTELLHLSADFQVCPTARFGFRIGGTEVLYDPAAARLSCKNCTAPLDPIDGKIRLEILIDRNSIEIFANDGRIYMPVAAAPRPDNDRSLQLFSTPPSTTLNSLHLHSLASVWP